MVIMFSVLVECVSISEIRYLEPNMFTQWAKLWLPRVLFIINCLQEMMLMKVIIKLKQKTCLLETKLCLDGIQNEDLHLHATHTLQEASLHPHGPNLLAADENQSLITTGLRPDSCKTITGKRCNVVG